MLPTTLVLAISLTLALCVDAWLSPVEPGMPRRRRRSWGWLGEFLNQSGLHDVTPRDFVLFSLGTGLLAGAVCLALSDWLLVAVLVGLAGASVPFLLYASRADARRARVQASLAEAMALLRDSVRAGSDVPQGLGGLAKYGPVELRPEFQLVVDSMAHGATLREALLRLRDRLADPVLDSCVATLLLNASLGSAQLTPVLSELAASVREELRVQADIRAQRTRMVWSARAIAAMPIVLLFGLRVIAPGYMSVFDSVLGQFTLAACGLSILCGYAVMRWVSRLPTERRVLVG